MNWHARCTSGECALRFSALAPFSRARSCEYIMRNSTLRVRDAGAARAVQKAGCRAGAGCREPGAAGGKRGTLRAGSGHLSIESVNAEEDECAQQSA